MTITNWTSYWGRLCARWPMWANPFGILVIGAQENQAAHHETFMAGVVHGVGTLRELQELEAVEQAERQQAAAAAFEQYDLDARLRDAG